MKMKSLLNNLENKDYEAELVFGGGFRPIKKAVAP